MAGPWGDAGRFLRRGYHIFQNRAAMKMAEMDWLFNLTARELNNPQDNEAGPAHAGLFYFADICAGPGGFTEYMVWRRQLAYKASCPAASTDWGGMPSSAGRLILRALLRALRRQGRLMRMRRRGCVAAV